MTGLDLLGYQMFGANVNSKFNPMRDVTFAISLHDSACYNGLLARAASHKEAIHCRKAWPASVKHRLSAIREVNYRLSDPARSVEDSTLMAIATFWCLEVYLDTSVMERDW